MFNQLYSFLRFIFNIDGTFTHITNNTNDDPTTDVSGTVFGRDGLIDEIGTGGTVNGADVENLPYDDYTSSYSLIAPGGVETISPLDVNFQTSNAATIYFIINIMPIAIPFHIYNQNKYHMQTLDGFVML